MQAGKEALLSRNATLSVDIRICMTLNLNKIGAHARREQRVSRDEVRELFGNTN